MRDALRLLALRWRSRGRVRLARSVRVGAGVRVTALPGAAVVLGPDVVLEDGARISALAGTVKVGAQARLGERAVVVCHASVDIGSAALIGNWAAVADVEPTYADVERPVRTQPVLARGVSIGAGAVVGPHAVVGAGARVEPGEVVEPYAVVGYLAATRGATNDA